MKLIKEDVPENNIPTISWKLTKFKYIGATLAQNGELDAEMTHRIQSGWKNWKRIGLSGILCDRRISLRVKGKVYKTDQKWCSVSRRGQ